MVHKSLEVIVKIYVRKNTINFVVLIFAEDCPLVLMTKVYSRLLQTFKMERIAAIYNDYRLLTMLIKFFI